MGGSSDPAWRAVDEETRRRLDYDQDQDGEFWMSEADFKANFAEVTVCTLKPDLDQDGQADDFVNSADIRGAWKGPPGSSDLSSKPFCSQDTRPAAAATTLEATPTILSSSSASSAQVTSSSSHQNFLLCSSYFICRFTLNLALGCVEFRSPSRRDLISRLA
ncbi:MAG: C2 family cysteine protease [Verrucomicrobiota bacterium]